MKKSNRWAQLEKKQYLSLFGGAQLSESDKAELSAFQNQHYKSIMSECAVPSVIDRIRLMFVCAKEIPVPNGPESGCTDLSGNPIHLFKFKNGKAYYYGPHKGFGFPGS